jgi:multiple sugar transport system permease protein
VPLDASSAVQEGAAMAVNADVGVNAPKPSHRSRFARHEMHVAYLLVLPTMVLFLIFVAGPMFASMALTFLQWDGLSAIHFAGLDNYGTLLHDGLLRTVILNTVVFVIASVALKMLLALFLAVVVYRYTTRFISTVFRSIVFFPVVISGVAVGIIWQWLMSTSFGLINYYLGVFGLSPIAWLDSSQYAMTSLVVVDVWRSVGFSFVVFTAGLQGIPVHLYEAADLDGAGEWAKFRYITLALLSPTTFFLLAINLINAFQFFDLSYIMTQGGPGDATRTLVYYIYFEGFRFFRFGYASTVALLLFVILALLTFIQVRLSGRWVFYE